MQDEKIKALTVFLLRSTAPCPKGSRLYKGGSPWDREQCIGGAIYYFES
jgi:hypothetical protein